MNQVARLLSESRSWNVIETVGIEAGKFAHLLLYVGYVKTCCVLLIKSLDEFKAAQKTRGQRLIR